MLILSGGEPLLRPDIFDISRRAKQMGFYTSLSTNGTLIGPWGTIVNFDLGFPVEGPADDFVAYVVFLKLFGS